MEGDDDYGEGYQAGFERVFPIFNVIPFDISLLEKSGNSYFTVFRRLYGVRSICKHRQYESQRRSNQHRFSFSW